jgi:hypothetical protein
VPTEKYSSRTSCPFLHDRPVEFFSAIVLPCAVAHKYKFLPPLNAVQILPLSAPRTFAAKHVALVLASPWPPCRLIYGTAIRNPRKRLKT